MKVLVVCAHPDDAEFQVAGTIAKYVKHGHDTTILYITSGDKGHLTIEPQELVKIREKESKKACDILGAKPKFLRVLDEEVYYNPEQEFKLIETIRQEKPEIILTHNPEDYHSDHVATSKLVFHSLIKITLPWVKTKSPAFNKAIRVYYYESLAGIGFIPEYWVDITDTFEKKKASLSAHESQMKFLAEMWPMSPIEFMENIAKYRGQQAGVTYAECFRVLRQYPRIIPVNLPP